MVTHEPAPKPLEIFWQHFSNPYGKFELAIRLLVFLDTPSLTASNLCNSPIRVIKANLKNRDVAVIDKYGRGERI